ncbi:hypothetical protein HMPREF9943_01172 [Eggerthia catenaformis OT 569 = DSM 20559]|uniref:ABC transporter domain-containing protein n=1 Tax=Eggerthia catenaformis OT 569 = DSM 20559 TaxID=999415 RepID=M2NEI1_9FIRM|nr:hypothetical protein HMPREF9943_01172 [Eggerthia catenaformis OT 569 = DSM 20559]OUC51217.1 ABC transporter [Eggerthia catenaformis]
MAEIEIKNLSKHFYSTQGKVEALKNVNLEIEKGDIFGIIGMSGAGKSTLVRCLNFLEKPTYGDVIIQGIHLKNLTEKELRAERKKITMIFQNFNLLMQKTVIDNVCFPLRISGISKNDAYKKAIDYLKIVGLEDKAKSYPAMLSGGQKQRVAIARALACDPEILLCDEATSALDPATTSSILALLSKINEEMGITIVIITHQMSVIQDICKNVAIMEDGTVQETGTVEEIFKNPQSKVGKRLILSDDIRTTDELKSNVQYRIVFNEQSSFEPVIANLILKFKKPVNILYANTRDVHGSAMGDMIVDFGEGDPSEMIAFLKERGLSVKEVNQ